MVCTAMLLLSLYTYDGGRPGPDAIDVCIANTDWLTGMVCQAPVVIVTHNLIGWRVRDVDWGRVLSVSIEVILAVLSSLYCR